jgi:hypothetical protein
MTKRLSDAIAQLRTLSEPEQERAAEILLSLLSGAYELEREEQ